MLLQAMSFPSPLHNSHPVTAVLPLYGLFYKSWSKATLRKKEKRWGSFPQPQWGPHKGERPLWGEEKHGEQVELSVRKVEQCSRRFDDGASIAFG